MALNPNTSNDESRYLDGRSCSLGYAVQTKVSAQTLTKLPNISVSLTKL